MMTTDPEQQQPTGPTSIHDRWQEAEVPVEVTAGPLEVPVENWIEP